MNSPIEIYTNTAYLYDGTTEGLLSAIFAAYKRHETPFEIVREQEYQPRLLQQTVHIATNEEHAQRVLAGIHSKLGTYTVSTILQASLSGSPETGTIIYQFIRYALPYGKGAINNLANSHAKALHNLAVSVGKECEKIRQFARFEHLKDETGEIWFARVNPKDAVVVLVMNHFVERFNIQPFILYDEVHEVAGVWDGVHIQFVDTRTAHLTLPTQTAHEKTMQQAWRTFYHTLSIQARHNPELRRQLMPKRFWKNLTEMQPATPALQLSC